MAAGPFIVPQLAHANMYNATGLLSPTLTLANLRLALVSSAWVPNDGTDELWAVASGSEIANGNGYSTGGIALPSPTWTQTGAVIKLTSSPIVWNATGSGIPAWYRAVLYYLGTLNGKVNPLLAHCLGDSTPANVPLTTAGNPLTITPHANGIINSTKS